MTPRQHLKLQWLKVQEVSWAPSVPGGGWPFRLLASVARPSNGELNQAARKALNLRAESELGGRKWKLTPTVWEDVRYHPQKTVRRGSRAIDFAIVRIRGTNRGTCWGSCSDDGRGRSVGRCVELGLT